jgi:hypothetical protein
LLLRRLEQRVVKHNDLTADPLGENSHSTRASDTRSKISSAVSNIGGASLCATISSLATTSFTFVRFIDDPEGADIYASGDGATVMVLHKTLRIIGQSIAMFHDKVKPQPSPLRRVFLWLISILILLGVVESMCAIFLKFVLASRAHFLIWNPDFDGARKARSATAGNWDDELGWPSPRDAVAPPHDRTGAKYNSDFPQPGHACASAYGGSFVWGDDVPLADGWIEQLSRKLGCRVPNYGVPGYGTDQAFLRFMSMTQDEAPAAMLGSILRT